MRTKERLTAREKAEANANRLRSFDASDWCCVRCRRRPEDHGDYLQLAHRIRKGLLFKYGAEVVHHAISAVPSCSTCNQLLLVHNEEERALVERIQGVLDSGEQLNLREEYRALRKAFEEQRRES